MSLKTVDIFVIHLYTVLNVISKRAGEKCYDFELIKIIMKITKKKLVTTVQ
jgi:hypothetical protein